jgi:hypothetical protein
MVHTCAHEAEPMYSSPDGASQFQYPGLARSLALYCADGLVFFLRPDSSKIPYASADEAGSSQAGDLLSAAFIC